MARVQNDTRVRMAQMPDRCIRERLQDLEDLLNRLLSHLMRQSRIFSPKTSRTILFDYALDGACGFA